MNPTNQKPNLLVSFSGGRTSAYMSKMIWDYGKDYFNLVFVFANTGLERIETLQFVHRCSYFFGFKVHYIESKINPGKGNGTTYTTVDRWDNMKLSDSHETPFEQMIIKYGLPNPAFPHCTRELKTVPIRKFGQDYFGTNDFYQAIGIRNDEIDRMSVKRKENKLVYPLIHAMPTTEKDVDAFWSKQCFDLEIEGYEGNCALCWKKDFRKLALISQESKWEANNWYRLEARYKGHYPNGVIKDEWGVRDVPILMYRGHTSLADIQKMEVSKEEVLNIKKSKQESCDAHAECGLDN